MYWNYMSYYIVFCYYFIILYYILYDVIVYSKRNGFSDDIELRYTKNPKTQETSLPQCSDIWISAGFEAF